MANDRAMGFAILGGSIIGILLYGWLLYYWTVEVLEASAFLAVLVLFGILGWIGYTMATTPPPEPITEIPDAGKPAPPAETKPK